MSNVWYYNLLVNPQHLPSSERVVESLALAEARGYSIRHPDTGQILIAKTDLELLEYQPLEFENPTSAVELLGKSGGLVDLWKGKANIGLEFDFTGTQEAWIIKTLGLLDTPTFGKVSISVGNYLFRCDSAQREELAEDIKTLFCDLCIFLDAVYGYSADETILESFVANMHIHEDAKFQRKPSVLFWLNYFASAYIAQIDGQHKFQQVGGKTKESPKGVLVSFFEHPWQVDVLKLHSINEKWREL